MLNKLVPIGIAAGLFASVPIVYQSNPDLFHAFVAPPGAERPDMEEAGPVRVAAAVPRPGEAEVLLGRKVRLRADPRGHFTAGFRLNGRTVEAMVDTGATLVAINRSTARRIGIALSPSDFRYEVDTANGRARAAGAMIDTLQIGRIHVEGVQAVVLEDDALKGALIGMSFLGQLSKFQIERDGLLLEQ